LNKVLFRTFLFRTSVFFYFCLYCNHQIQLGGLELQNGKPKNYIYKTKMKSINYSGWIRSLFRYASQKSDPILKSNDLLFRKTGEIQLRKIDDFKFAIYTYTTK